jgi:hypothetical protein
LFESIFCFVLEIKAKLDSRVKQNNPEKQNKQMEAFTGIKINLDKNSLSATRNIQAG